MRASVSYKWKPLEDLPQNWQELASEELEALAGIWQEQRASLVQTDAWQVFLERLQREWAIETGIIERVYILDRGVTQLLIEKGIDASLIPHEATDRDPESVTRVIQDHQEAMEGLFAFVKGEREISTAYTKEIHAVMMRNQESSLAKNNLGRNIETPLLRGDYKKRPNNPLRPDGTLHEYCPPEQVASEMDRLIELHKAHQQIEVPPEVESAWFHHRFTQIHPFQDGNGRVARALSTLILIKANWFPLVVTRDDRERYIYALEKADQGDLTDLVSLFVFLQKKAFVQALGLSEEALQRQQVDQIISSARDTLSKRREVLRNEWKRANETANTLQNAAETRFDEVASKLREELSRISSGYEFFLDNEKDGGQRSHYFRYQINETAKNLGYFANTHIYHAWTRLVLRTKTQAEILLSFHGMGHEYRGLLAASMCFFRREEVDEDKREVTPPSTISEEVFQINYRESPESTKSRFQRWLEHGLVKGLEIWRKGI